MSHIYICLRLETLLMLWYCINLFPHLITFVSENYFFHLYNIVDIALSKHSFFEFINNEGRLYPRMWYQTLIHFVIILYYIVLCTYYVLACHTIIQKNIRGHSQLKNKICWSVKGNIHPGGVMAIHNPRPPLWALQNIHIATS